MLDLVGGNGATRQQRAFVLQDGHYEANQDFDQLDVWTCLKASRRPLLTEGIGIGSFLLGSVSIN
jgi:hypothetical protein